MKTNWQTKKLGEVCSVGAGNSAPQKKDFFIDGKYPFFRTSDVGQIHIGNIIESSDYLNEKGIKGLKLFQRGTILIPKSGASTFLNHRVIIGVDGYVSSHLATIKTDETILNNIFLFYFLQEVKAQDLIQDHKYPSLNLPVIENIEIPIPPLTEQKRIVRTLDEAFKKLKTAKQNVENNSSNLQDLFEVYLENILVNNELPVRALGKFCEDVEYGTSSKSKQHGKIPVLRMGNIQNGRFEWGKLVYSDNSEDNKKYILKYNDVLFNRTNSPELVGKTAIYKGEMPAIFAGYLIRIRRKENLLDADYLNYYLNSKMMLDYGKTVFISSVNQANINGTKLKEYPIRLPSLKDQKTIVKKLNQLSEQTKKLESIYKKKLENIEELKKSILHKAFSGEL
jgi:type I restriction enzyme S subunit